MEIKKPKLIVDLKRVEQNIVRMYEKFKNNDILFRPHFKTHQSHFIGEMFRKQGVDKCTVSSVGMAKYFANDGWNDITIAFPTNLNETKEINDLAEKIKLQILVDSIEKVKLLTKEISSSVNLLIEVDTGYFRSGIQFDEEKEIASIIRTIESVPQFTFDGFLSHTGNTYTQSSPSEIVELFEDSREKLVRLKSRFKQEYPNLILSMGDTPAASLATEFSGVDEMRPGNFVFYDVTQHLLGSCKLNEIGVAVYCPVVALYTSRNQVIVYGGGVHLSKEKTLWQGQAIYGLISIPDNSGFGRFISKSFVMSLSQEHGVISIPENEMDKLKLGDILAIYPVHSCMTVDLNKELISLDGEVITKYRTY